MNKQVTFLSVSCHSEEYLKLNNEKIKADRWLIDSDVYDENLREKLPGFDILPYQSLNIPTVKNEFVSTASYRHSTRLNLLARMTIDTRFVCFLDPDFYLIKQKEKVVDDMLAAGLTFAGAPYWPKVLHKKIYERPVAFCLFVDRDKFDISTIDFTPQGVLADGTIADTGYLLYKDMQPSHFSSATPDYHRFYNEIHNCNNQFEFYTDQDGVFGVHLRAKVHLTDGLERKIKIKQDISKMKTIMEKIENDKAVQAVCC